MISQFIAILAFVGASSQNFVPGYAAIQEKCEANIVYEQPVTDQPLPEKFPAALNRVAVKLLDDFFGEECVSHMINSTFETEYYKQFENVSPEELHKQYVNSYGSNERGRGILNTYGLDCFESLTDVHLIRRFSEYVAMSYCDEVESIEKMAALNLRVGNFTVDVVKKDFKRLPMYFIATNPAQNITALVLRGSDNAYDFILDAMVKQIPFDYKELPIPGINETTGAKVHQGFWEKFDDTHDQIAKDVQKTLKKYSETTKLVVIGHSLGGAWAVLEAADLVVNHKVNVTAVYTYGQPMVGNVELMDPLLDVIGNDKYIRVVNMNDMIPHVGFMPNGSFGSQNRESFVFRCPPEYGFKVCAPGQDSSCSFHYQCLDWTWRTHSELGGFQLRESFCNSTIPTPNSVYDPIGPSFLVAPAPVPQSN